MPLHLINTASEGAVPPPAVERLRRAVVASGRATLLVPSFARALDAQRALASEHGLGLGVRVTTPSAWAAERWGVWGDGRRPVDAASREILCARVVGSAASAPGSEVRDNPGMVALLSGLVSRGLPWLRGRGGAVPGGVSAAEAAAVSLVDAYDAELSRLGLIEGVDMMSSLAGLLPAGEASPVVMTGFEDMPRALRELVVALARGREVDVCLRAGEGPADELARALLGSLERAARDAGVEVDVASDPARAARRRAPELDRVLGRLFSPTPEPVAPEGALRLALPAGPAAEPALVADEVARLARGGASSVAVASPDPAGAWRELAGRLRARGISVRAELRVGLASLEAGRAFIELIEGVARLEALGRDWPEPRELPSGSVEVGLGDMGWWPPRGLSDFLMSGISGVDAGRARSLDREWRSNRLLTPSAVLERLQNEKATSKPCAQAVRELLRGRVGSAASKLLAGLSDEGAEAEYALEARAVLGRVLDVARSLKECGLTADPEAQARVGLDELVRVASSALRRSTVVLRMRREAPGAACEALVVSSLAPDLAPASFDALVACGLTSAESPVSASDTALAAILDAYGAVPAGDAMPAARSSFRSLLACARSRVVAERCLFGPESRERYPSVMLTELLACYGVDAGAKVADVTRALGAANVSSRGESPVCENASRSGAAPSPEASEAPAPAGRIEPSLRRCATPSPEGGEGGPVLSASQIETYLECPYKWFSLRRLRLRDSDAGFTGAEMGTFAHRVLELAHSRLLAEAVERSQGTSELARIAETDPEGTDSKAYAEAVERLVARAQADPSARLEGSAPSSSAERAHELLVEVFSSHLAHQNLLVKGKKPLMQALVPHNGAEAGSIDALRRDLGTLIDYESQAFMGFEPRFFEWGFGKGGAQVEYAGVRLTGTVDRIDVDAHGQAVVIDYKHKSSAGFAAEYDAFGKEGAGAEAGLALPRRVQSLIYGQVVRRAFPDLEVRAAVYLCTKGSHEIAGAVDAEALDNVFGALAPRAARAARLEVPRAHAFGTGGERRGMEALLDACEEAVAEQVSHMLAGDIEARPAYPNSCEHCPVLNCERRRSK